MMLPHRQDFLQEILETIKSDRKSYVSPGSPPTQPKDCSLEPAKPANGGQLL